MSVSRAGYLRYGLPVTEQVCTMSRFFCLHPSGAAGSKRTPDAHQTAGLSRRRSRPSGSSCESSAQGLRQVMAALFGQGDWVRFVSGWDPEEHALHVGYACSGGAAIRVSGKTAPLGLLGLWCADVCVCRVEKIAPSPCFTPGHNMSKYDVSVGRLFPGRSHSFSVCRAVPASVPHGIPVTSQWILSKAMGLLSLQISFGTTC